MTVGDVARFIEKLSLLKQEHEAFEYLSYEQEYAKQHFSRYKGTLQIDRLGRYPCLYGRATLCTQHSSGSITIPKLDKLRENCTISTLTLQIIDGH